MTSGSTSGLRLTSTRIDIPPAQSGDHFHVCPGLVVDMVGPARLNPRFGYRIVQQGGRWLLVSTLSGRNVIGAVEWLDGPGFAPGATYTIDHVTGGGCAMVVRVADASEIDGRANTAT